MSTHVVESNSQTVRSGYLDPSAPPAAAVLPRRYGPLAPIPGRTSGNEAVYGMTFAEREPLGTATRTARTPWSDRSR